MSPRAANDPVLEAGILVDGRNAVQQNLSGRGGGVDDVEDLRLVSPQPAAYGRHAVFLSSMRSATCFMVKTSMSAVLRARTTSSMTDSNTEKAVSDSARFSG